MRVHHDDGDDEKLISWIFPYDSMTCIYRTNVWCKRYIEREWEKKRTEIKALVVFMFAKNEYSVLLLFIWK